MNTFCYDTATLTRSSQLTHVTFLYQANPLSMSFTRTVSWYIHSKTHFADEWERCRSKVFERPMTD